MLQIWRYIKTPLILGLLLAGLFYASLWGYNHLKAPIPKKPPAPCVSFDTGPTLEPWRVSVEVLNGGSRSGLANRQGTLLRQAGFNVVKVGNSKDRIRTTAVVGFAADSPEVALVASHFTKPEIRGDGRVDHSVTVFLGNDFAGNNEKPLKSTPVPGNKLCLPADTPTAPPK